MMHQHRPWHPRRAHAAISEGPFIYVGAPSADVFTNNVFTRELKNATKISVTAAVTDAIRAELIDLLTTQTGSLDIVAEAPYGVQYLEGIPLGTLLSSPIAGGANPLLDIIRTNFEQCRLLGCRTAIDADTNTARTAHKIADLIQLPVVATLRPIDYADFDDDSFHEAQVRKDGEIVGNVERFEPNTADSPSQTAQRLNIADQLQTDWLASYPRIAIDVVDIPSSNHHHGFVWHFAGKIAPKGGVITGTIPGSVLDHVVVKTATGQMYDAEVLVGGTLLRIRSDKGPIYLSVKLTDPARLAWLQQFI